MARKLEGMDKVLANLEKEIKGIKGRSVAGLLAGGLVVQRNAQERVPVHHGILKSSAFTRRAHDDPQAVEVGFGGAAGAYAVAVHENIEMKWKGKPRRDGVGVYWGPKGESQFLLKAFRENAHRVVNVVAEYARAFAAGGKK